MKTLHYIIICTLFFLVGCAENNELDTTEADYFFHVKEQDAYLPVWVRGNIASKKILLYVQGGPGLNTMDFATVDYSGWEENIENDFAIAYYDQRGTGNAQGDFDLESVSLDQYVIDIHQIVKVLKTQFPDTEIYLFGHSFGGWLSYLYAQQYKDEALVDGLVTANAPFTTDRNEIRWTFRHQFLTRVAEDFIAANTNISYWEEVLAWTIDHPVIDEVEEMQEWNDYIVQGLSEYEVDVPLQTGKLLKAIFASSINIFPTLTSPSRLDKVAEQLFEDEVGINLLDGLEDFNLPLLMVTGSYDDIAPVEELEFAFERIASENKYFEILPDAGHDAMLNQPELFREVLRSFLEE